LIYICDSIIRMSAFTYITFLIFLSTLVNARYVVDKRSNRCRNSKIDVCQTTHSDSELEILQGQSILSDCECLEPCVGTNLDFDPFFNREDNVLKFTDQGGSVVEVCKNDLVCTTCESIIGKDAKCCDLTFVGRSERELIITGLVLLVLVMCGVAIGGACIFVSNR